MTNVEEKLKQEFDKQVNELAKANLMIIGGTGVGKSSLINKVFGQNYASVGAGKPITKGCHKYESDDIPITIFDTEGYEIIDNQTNNDNFRKVVLAEIQKYSKSDLKDQIHIFWYCISASLSRITNYDIQNIRELEKYTKNIAIVITQCDTEEIDENGNGKVSASYKKVLKEESINYDVFEVITLDNQENTLELDKLIEWSSKSLPQEQIRQAFIAAQKYNIELKNKEADTLIYTLSATCALSAGANPFPMSDAAIIAPQQIALAVKLANIYGFNGVQTQVTSILKSQVVSLVGRQLAASLTKFIPLVGNLINAGVAGGITLGLGNALKALYHKAYLELLETGKLPDWVKLFNDLELDKLNISEWINKFIQKDGKKE